MPDIPVTKNYKRLKKNDAAGKFFKVLEGSSGSGKTISIIQYLVEKALMQKRRITAFRNDQATCRDSIIADFKFVMIEQFGVWNPMAWNASNFDYTFPNGSVFQFRGASDPGKLHGPRREIAWLNEVMEISYGAFTQIAQRTNEEMIMDFNPSFNYHWVFEKVMKRDNCVHTHSTFRDNPMLPENDRKQILSYEPTPENKAAGTADQFNWDVYGLGRRGRREGAIFEIWDITDDWPDKMLCQRWGYGLDYGFSLDPSALVECALFQDTIYLREHFYEKKLVAQENPLDPTIDSIETHLRACKVPEDARIHADNARPEFNYALRKSGFKVVETKKSPTSVLTSIDRLRSYPLKVHRDSQNLQREIEAYCWDTNVAGEYLAKPVDRDNHLVDGARYWALAELEPRHVERMSRRAKIIPTNEKRWR